MKICQPHYTRNILICVLQCFLLAGYNQVPADEPSGEITRNIPEEEMPAILNLIANKVHDNYERIVTWSGEITVKLHMLHTGATAENIFKTLTDGVGETPEAILQKIEEKITFAIDTNKESVWIDNYRGKPSEFLDHTNNKNLGSRSGPYRSGPYWSTLIARPDFLLETKPKSFDSRTNEIKHRKVIKKPSQKEATTGLYKKIDDPRSIFLPGGEYIWRYLDMIANKINEFGKIEFDGYRFKMEEHKKGNIIEYKIIEPAIISLERSDPNHYVITTMIFSSQYGFNMIYREDVSGGGNPMQKFSWEYELVDGVYLPKRVVKKHYKSTGEVGLEKDCNYINNKLNRKIPSKTFEYTNLNLKEGDVFIDEIMNKEYKYKANTQTLEPIEK